ncbi:MAG: SUF system NifU family Fe-S cluster assembly protein [Actinomycetales bacterium mxb001]|nr:MAG: SUF system NifU family Fe-S cluster assembly protein [Actinomycetales bacterium mxb001]
MQDLYQEIILDHYRNPQGRGLREPFEAQVHHVNPTCGDEIDLRLHLSTIDGVTVVDDVSYEGQGCSISQASASVLYDSVVGQPLDEALASLDRFQEMLQSKGEISGDEETMGDAVAFAGVAKYPARVKCALLPWMAWKDAVVRVTEGENR